ncbi:hypothetical protein SAMN05444920_11459 [Nonomuraea solani]|uniref:Uncharacterized protein n=1 Tax=Nonomuraea solani TaxID=1144553 RepID=A0A1H6EQU2_9ACTN|nr:hypothetical protein [Nonomuraea solani]SEG99783.1 hypothetical protein SAMN05444920_11459 [Nonomuraea solani]
MPELHPSLADHGLRVIEHGLDAPLDADVVPLSCDVIEGDAAAVLFAHEDALEWVVYEYDHDWRSLGLTAIRVADTPLRGEGAQVEIRHDSSERSRIRGWGLRGRHLVHVRILRTHRIARLRVAARTVVALRGWAIVVWRGRQAPAISASGPQQ